MSAFRFQIGMLFCLWPVLVCAADVPDLAFGVAALPNPIARQRLDGLSATLARPLFLRGRRMPSPEPPPAVTAEKPLPPPPPSLVLLGTLKDNKGVQAILQEGSAEKVLRVRRGDAVGGWHIAEIAARRVILSHDDQTTSVSLFEHLGAKPFSGNGNKHRNALRDDDGIRGD